MYAKCGALLRAQYTFDELPNWNVVPWNALIAGYSHHGHSQEALICFECMQDHGFSPDAVTFTCVVKACGTICDAAKGRSVHEEILRRGLLNKDSVLSSSLVDMYAKFGELANAKQVFDEFHARDVVSWNALIGGFCQHGHPQEALKCFECMVQVGYSPDSVTFLHALKACGCIGAVIKGKEIHDEIVHKGLLGDNCVLGTAVVDMYARCGILWKAQEVFDGLPIRNAISWNALIAGYSQHYCPQEALACFDLMQQEGLCVDILTYASILKACGIAKAVKTGKKLHAEIVEKGLLGRNSLLGNALVDMYTKSGALACAQQMFDELPVRNIVSWNVLIAGYAEQGQGEEAFGYFEQMQREGFFPNAVTLACILKACGSMGAADKGGKLHVDIVKEGLIAQDGVLGIALVDMYAKCAALSKAQQVFDSLLARDIVLWIALISGYAEHGYGQEALYCFEKMKCEGLSPNSVTFLCILSACSSSDLVDIGHTYFNVMSSKHGLIPKLEHITCMVDLFSRGGLFDRAIVMIRKIPPLNCLPLWHAILSACRKWGSVKLARLAFEHAIQLDAKSALAYVYMCEIYIGAGMQEDADIIESMRSSNCLFGSKT